MVFAGHVTFIYGSAPSRRVFPFRMFPSFIARRVQAHTSLPSGKVILSLFSANPYFGRADTRFTPLSTTCVTSDPFLCTELPPHPHRERGEDPPDATIGTSEEDEDSATVGPFHLLVATPHGDRSGRRSPFSRRVLLSSSNFPSKGVHSPTLSTTLRVQVLLPTKKAPSFPYSPCSLLSQTRSYHCRSKP